MAKSQPFKEFIIKRKKGEKIYSAGDPGTEMYIVQSGAVEVFKETDKGRVSLAVMEKGDFFGEMALIESAPYDSSAEALEDCDLIEINSTLFDRMIKGNIEIAIRMLRKLSMRLRDVTRRVEELMTEAARPPAQAVAEEQQATRVAVASVEPGLVTQTGETPVVEVSSGPVTAAAAETPKDCHA